MKRCTQLEDSYVPECFEVTLSGGSRNRTHFLLLPIWANYVRPTTKCWIACGMSHGSWRRSVNGSPTFHSIKLETCEPLLPSATEPRHNAKGGTIYKQPPLIPHLFSYNNILHHNQPKHNQLYTTETTTWSMYTCNLTVLRSLADPHSQLDQGNLTPRDLARVLITNNPIRTKQTRLQVAASPAKRMRTTSTRVRLPATSAGPILPRLGGPTNVSISHRLRPGERHGPGQAEQRKCR